MSLVHYGRLHRSVIGIMIVVIGASDIWTDGLGFGWKIIT